MLSTQAGNALGAPKSLRGSGPVRYVAQMRTLLIAVAAGLLLAGCGSVSSCACSYGVLPTPSSGPGLFDLTVTEKEKVASMHVGQTVEVALHANTGMNNWAQVRSTDQSILVPVVNPAATAMRGVTLAAFRAMAPGEADITAYASPDCSPGQACPMYVQVWSVKVTVTA